MSAGRGVLGLLIGDRTSPRYFSFTLRGLAGSFIAFIVVTAINAVLPLGLGEGNEPGGIARSLIIVAILYGMQVGFAALVLRQLGRLDGLVPFMVADNWATFFLTLISVAISAAGMSGLVVVYGLGLVILVFEVNIARLVVTLPGLQVAMFVVARLVAAFVGVLIAQFLGLIPPIALDMPVS
ncbi:MAG: hypothetical protein ABL879_05610 [Devosia sp.]